MKLWAGLLLFATVSVYGATPSAANFEDAYLKTKDKILDKESDQREVMRRLYEMDFRIRSLTKKRRTITDKVFYAESKAKDLAKQIAELKKQIKSQRQVLGKRLRVMYQLGSQGVVRILFSAQSSSELDQNIRFLQKLSKQDQVFIRELAEQTKTLEGKTIQLRESVAQYAQLNKQLEGQEKGILAQQEEKSKVLKQIRKEHSSHLRKLTKMRGKIKDPSSLEWLLSQESFFEHRGAMPWPAQGQILQGFGLKQDEEFKFRVLHKGIFVSAVEGQAVKAVYSGTVSFVGEFPGMGSSVIVDHGDNYYSVYSYLKSHSVEKDTVVKQGDTLGLTGLSSRHQAPGVYFEIRHYSDPVDPQPWLLQARSER